MFIYHKYNASNYGILQFKLQFKLLPLYWFAFDKCGMQQHVGRTPFRSPYATCGLLTGNVYQAEIVERIVVERRQPNGFAQ